MATIPPDAILPEYPPVIRIEPAGACNLACRHCPTGTVDLRRGVMAATTFDKLCDDIAAHRDQLRVGVLYHGGEPFLNKRLFAMIRRLKTIGLSYLKTVSNGMLLNQQMAEESVHSKLDAIEFSLDGESEEESNFFRRHSDYHAIVKNIHGLLDTMRRLKATTPQVFISSTQFLTDVTDHRNTPPVPAHLLRDFREYLDLVQFKTVWAMEWPEMNLDHEIFDRVVNPDGTFRNECDHVINTTTVRWNGDIVPCCYDLTSRIVLGNILEDSISTIWQSEEYQALRRSIFDKQYVSLCSKCNTVRPEVYLTLRKQGLTST